MEQYTVLVEIKDGKICGGTYLDSDDQMENVMKRVAPGEPKIHQKNPGSGHYQGCIAVPRSRLDRSAPVRQDDAA